MPNAGQATVIADSSFVQGVHPQDFHKSRPARALVAQILGGTLDASFSERAVLAVLADRADSEGRAWPAVDEVAARTGLAPRSVRRILARLADPARPGGPLVERTTLAPWAASEADRRTPKGFAVSRAVALVRLTLGAVVPILRSVDLGSWFDPGRPLTTLQRVLGALVEAHANRETGEAWPGYARLATLAGCSTRAVGGSLGGMGRYLAARLVGPGSPLPGGVIAVGWHAVLRVKTDPDPDPRSACPRTLVPRDPDPRSEESYQGSPIRKKGPRPPEAPPPLPAGPIDPLPDLLRSYSRICDTDELGPKARETLAARMAEGCDARQLRAAFYGIRASEYLMGRFSRREVRNALRTRARVADLAKDGGWVEPDTVDPAQIAREDAAAARVRASDAAAAASGPAFVRGLPGGLLGALPARPSF